MKNSCFSCCEWENGPLEHVIIGLGLGSVIIGGVLAYRYYRYRMNLYRLAYQDLIQRAYEFSLFASQVAKKVEGSQDPQRVAHVERLVESFESFATTLKQLPSSGLQVRRIEFLRFLMKDLARSFFQLFRMVGGESTGVCYACSKPDSQLFPLKFLWNGKVGVYGCCQSCQRLFSLKKRLQILCFMSKNHPAHWSEFIEYQPQQHFESLRSGEIPDELQRCDVMVFGSQKGE